jgi:NAD(P)-dependent dehydrogenase (short-subunit alcohol dehydrogenase family)
MTIDLSTEVVAMPTDVGEESQARAFVERAHSELGRLDVLVRPSEQAG